VFLCRRQLRHQREADQVVAARHHRAGAQLNWVAQISANLLRDEELVDLIAESGGKWIFIGMESLDRRIWPASTRASISPASIRKYWNGSRAGTSTPSRRSSSAR